MRTLTDAISIRLTPTQMSVIWPGLDFLVRAEASRQGKGILHYGHPFRIYPAPPNFDLGRYSPELMDQIEGLWKRLRGKKGRGGRLQISAIELRVAVFSVRVTKGISRLRVRAVRIQAGAKAAAPGVGEASHEQEMRERLASLNIDPERFFALRKQAAERAKMLARKSERESKQESDRQTRNAPQTIRSLERHLKRANRLLRKLSTPAKYEASMQKWREHLRWMRLHLVYFKPWPPVSRSKKRQQKNLDALTKMAIRGLKNEGYALPEPDELRHALRGYSRSSRRGHQGAYTVPEMLRNSNNFNYKRRLAQWVLPRVHAKRLP